MTENFTGIKLLKNLEIISSGAFAIIMSNFIRLPRNLMIRLTHNLTGTVMLCYLAVTICGTILLIQIAVNKLDQGTKS